MSQANKKRTLIAISGGIAAYKSAELVRALVKQGTEVRVCMTRSACEFITPLTLQALSGNPVHTDLLDPAAEAGMGHIELARWADNILIAPATANIMAKLAHGIADDLVSTICLASEAPIHLAPAMNRVMWQNPATQANINVLTQRGFFIHGPACGEQACGETGEGRMLEAGQLAQLIHNSHANPAHNADDILLKPLENKQVLITAGPTREAIDPVRFISNRSSGKMGYALAEAARDLGATVTLISGPVALEAPAGIKRILVESAKQMHKATMQQAESADIFIATAAVSDYTPKQAASQKIKKSSKGMLLKLDYNPDILADVSQQYPALFTVGFAAETEKLVEHALDKLKRKNLDMIVANQVGENKGFETDTNQVEILWDGGQISLPEQGKRQLAKQIMETVTKRSVNHPVLV
jgi:phosphopantothenoylcysteine decarboxylase/phosphopantothenate--cysteine ligase